MIAHVFDISQYISAGAQTDKRISLGIVEDEREYRELYMPIGGVSYLLNTVEEFFSPDSELIYCADRTPTFKRELHNTIVNDHKGYKGNRSSKDPYLAIYEQRVLAEEILKQCGFNVIASDGYEADDCIHTVVSSIRDTYDRVIIHTNDSDQYYLVGGNVIIHPMSLRGKYVDLNNYERSVKAGYYVEYNTSILFKMYYGEDGDNIPAISPEMTQRVQSCIPSDAYSFCGDLKFLRTLVANACNGDAYTMGIFDLIAPMDIDRRDTILMQQDFNKGLFEYYASETCNKYYNRNREYETYELGNETLKRYCKMYLDKIEEVM